jgi:hypothetical protein
MNSVNLSKAFLLDWYPLAPGLRLRPPIDEMLTIVFSPPFINNDNNDLVVRYKPLMLTSQFIHHATGSLSVIGTYSLRYPALLMRISRRPNVFSISFKAFSTLFSSVTSSLRVKTLGAFFPFAWAADRTSASKLARSERAARAMPSAPALAKLIAAARPRPLEAPVMYTILPLRSAFAESIAGYVSW